MPASREQLERDQQPAQPDQDQVAEDAVEQQVEDAEAQARADQAK